MRESRENALIDDAIDRNDANEPTLPTASADPTLQIESTESTEPTDPIDSSESFDPIDHFPCTRFGSSAMTAA